MNLTCVAACNQFVADALLCRDALQDKAKAAQLIKRALAVAPHDEWLQRHAKSFQ